ncbi:hypothetical protein AB833_19690 [Chromatiales bacterium (ex Bugula neritina AB1)]|nr:hypothetical protein AB833_19690 [Chromatiales bacterium (ex Bugula neritina AB1)]
MPQLIVTAETGESRSLSLSAQLISIGRRRDNSLCLPHLSVSGHHARIIDDKGCLILEDLGSTNGTSVNGRRIEKHGLLHSDEIKIGNYMLRYSETYTSNPEPVAELQNVTPLRSIEPIIDPDLEQIISEVAALKVSSGEKAGAIVPLDKPVTTVGRSGGDVGAIAKKPTGYYFLPMSNSSNAIKHNGVELKPRIEIKLAGGDLIQISGEQLEFIYPYYGQGIGMRSS